VHTKVSLEVMYIIDAICFLCYCYYMTQSNTTGYLHGFLPGYFGKCVKKTLLNFRCGDNLNRRFC